MGTATPEKTFAAELLANPLLHQSTTYQSPVDDDHKPLTVSFSTTTNFQDENAKDLPTVLYLGPMMCSRYLLAYLNALACSKGVKVVFIERPGFGTSTPVPVSARLQHVLASIPCVLSHLKIQRVFLLSASAGTLYLLNFLTTPSLRAYLHPRHPYVGALVPWVHPDFSQSRLFSTAARLPAALIGSCGTLQRFVGTKIMPGIGWSGSIFGSLGLAVGLSTNKSDDDSNSTSVNESKKALERTAMTTKQLEALDDVVMQTIMQEDTSGFGHEALMCLRKDLPLSSWGIANSYPDFVKTLAEQETKRIQDSSTTTTSSIQPSSSQSGIPPSSSTSSASPPPSSSSAASKLRFRVFFASSDMLIGENGRKYFDDCFQSCPLLSNGVEYSSAVVKDSNHDSVIDVREGAIAAIFDDIVALTAATAAAE